MGKIQMSESIQINRSAETVFQCVTDVSQAPSWRPNLTVMNFSGNPIEIGSTWDYVTKFMGRDLVAKHEVTALEAGRHFKMKQDAGVASGYATWDIIPVTDGTSTATLSFDGEISGWVAGLASGLFQNQAKKAMKRDLANLKANLESS